MKDKLIANLKAIATPIARVVFYPARLIALAYSYVLTGKKVQEPYDWKSI